MGVGGARKKKEEEGESRKGEYNMGKVHHPSNYSNESGYIHQVASDPS